MKLRVVGLNLLLAIVYALAYMRCYVLFLNRHFEYVGYDLFQREPLFLALSVACAALPVLCYRGVRAVSSAIAVLVYLVLYVPIILTFALGSSHPVGEIAAIQLTFLAGMSLLFLADAIVIRNPLQLDLGVELMPVALAFTVLATAYTMFLYRGSLQFTSFGDELYVQRAANELLGAGLLTRYLSSWLSTVLVPLCLAYGFSTGRHHYTVCASIACLILYMAAANKLIVLMPFLYFAFHTLLRRRVRTMFPLLTANLTLLVTALLAIAVPGTIAFVATAIVLNRTIGNGGQLTMAYYDYFSFYARTGYSHVNGLNLFTRPYPYGDQLLGQVIGQFYWSPFMNANANFWATDGIAAMGLIGVLLISVVAALLFVVINSVTERYDRLFAVLCFLPFVSTLLNQSLFSSFWSGGGLFLILFFAFNHRGRDVRDDGAAAPRAARTPVRFTGRVVDPAADLR